MRSEAAGRKKRVVVLAGDPDRPLDNTSSRCMRFWISAGLLVMFAGCGHEVGKSLSDGYLHVDTDVYNAWIVRDNDTVVDTNVTHALALDEFVAGLRVRSTKLVGFTETEISGEYGYFFLDKSTGTLIQGQSESEMKRIFEENDWVFSLLASATPYQIVKGYVCA